MLAFEESDPVERHCFFTTILVIIFPFLFPPKKEGREKENELAK